MEKQHNKIHKSWLLFSLIKGIRDVAFIYILFSFVQNFFFVSEMVKILVISAIFLCIIIYKFIYWKNYSFEFDSNQLIIKQGGIWKQVNHIPKKNIIGYNEKQNIFEQIFKLSSIKLNLDSSNSEKSVEIPTLSLKQSTYIKNNISNFSKPLKNVKNDRYSISKNLLIRKSIASVSIIFFILFLYSFYSKISEYFNIEWIVYELQSFFTNNLLTYLLGILILIILSLIYGFIKTFIKYKNFSMQNFSDTIHTKWGIFTTYNNSIKKVNISSILLQSSFFDRVFALTKIKVISTEAKEEKKVETDLVMPICEKKNTLKILKDIFNVNISNIKFYDIPKLSIFPKIIRTSYLWGTLLILSFLFFENFWWVYCIFACYILLSQILQVFFTKLHFSKKYLILNKNGLSSTNVITTFNDIEELIITESFIQKLCGVKSIQFINLSLPPKKYIIHDVSKNHANSIYNMYQYNRINNIY
ncbi:PH domain-containing protein [Staphylococcus xylosus]|uniref:PH domain-containing protein n=1 Tax=Staphylococcus xylosus TaxID=1288 RepID=UPI001CDD8C2E|nr:PH domain-containing protein [Staphylococcus xylosus]MCA2503999.1 PH domain-containing protein [Staphylococcus xylosus]